MPLLFLIAAHCTLAADKPDAYRAELLALHNAARAEEELPPLAHNDRLAKAAQRHAEHMAATGKFAHEDIGSGTIESRIDDAGYRWRAVAENLARGPAQPRQAMRQWLASEPHRETLLGEYREVGFGRAAAGDGRVYWVACFATPRADDKVTR